MTTPFTATEMRAQELGATAHAALLGSDGGRAAASGLEHETSRDIPPRPLHPALISGCRVAHVGGELWVHDGTAVGANGDAMGGVAMVAASVGSRAKRATLGLHEVQEYQGVFHQMLLAGGLAALFGSSSDWSLFIVARLQSLGAMTPILWESGSALRVYYDPTGELFRVVVQTSAGSQSFSANLPKAGFDYLASGPSATLIEIESRSGVLSVRVGVAAGYASLLASQAIAGAPIASTATIRVGSDNAGAWATMHIGCIAAFGRALTDVELFQLRGWAVQEFGAAIASGVVQPVVGPPAPTVSISGTVTIGGTLTAVEVGTVTSRQWQRGDVVDGTGTYSACGGVDTGATYTPIADDIGFSIRCVSTGPGGSGTSNVLIFSLPATDYVGDYDGTNVTITGGRVSVALDQSPAGNDLDEGTAGSRPTQSVGGGPNGRDAIDFALNAGAAVRLSNLAMGLGEPCTIYSVTESPASGRYVHDANSLNNRVLLHSGADLAQYAFGAFGATRPAPADGTWIVAASVYNVGSSKLALDGGAAGTGAVGAGTAVGHHMGGTLTLGAAQCLNAKIARQIIYDAAHSDADRADVTAYLMNWAGI